VGHFEMMIEIELLKVNGGIPVFYGEKYGILG